MARVSSRCGPALKISRTGQKISELSLPVPLEACMKTDYWFNRRWLNGAPSFWPLIIPLMLACCALSPSAQAVDPPPDGGYSGDNTAEGDDALFSLTTGLSNTAIGFQALYSNTTGSYNTATGIQAL